MSFTVRAYAQEDERGWLRCRVLAFLSTQYYDDVKPRRTRFELPAVCLVAAADDGTIVGLIDVEIDGDTATIDTVAVHPDHTHNGIATALLAEAVPQARAAGATTLDAWTREDIAANAWYLRAGFTEDFRYLHVYKDGDEPTDGFAAPVGLSVPVIAFMHADISHEAEMRARYSRVYVCRQYLRRLGDD
ncbi:GNAT family N-acetyltransferase [Promicromonospora sukumoe]|uniref:Ribosomal protein S18 acetylase RimI-like enzyme n=1 Tax=Promicromonospora sukumoe TaxID=88382 RepID=A0A7W3J8F6_9MICO|nr:GNAT family N-acetyltransferase [Promicromonospora sukumoe]MBA8808059.1 ribosomal protein S18 acetylase RimI-like enzyme [Promicromonospora sukumoe]